MYDTLGYYHNNMKLLGLPADAQPAGVDQEGTEHLQHRVPRADPPGFHRVCGARGAPRRSTRQIQQSPQQGATADQEVGAAIKLSLAEIRNFETLTQGHNKSSHFT